MEDEKKPTARNAAKTPETPAVAVAAPVVAPPAPIRNPKNLVEGLEVNFLTGDQSVARKHYFAQLKQECPVDALPAGMITFMKQTYRWDENGAQLHTRGQVYALTEEELDWSIKSLQMRLCRPAYVLVNGSKVPQGCQDVLWATWKDGVLTRFPSFAAEPGDHAWTKYVVLRQITEVDMHALEQIGTPVSPIADARAQNERDEDEAESLAAVGGVAQKTSQAARKQMRASGVMGRE